jgi:hypothetical protein
VGLRACLGDVEKILDPARTQTPTFFSPARSQSLYRLRYPGSTFRKEDWKLLSFLQDLETPTLKYDAIF